MSIDSVIVRSATADPTDAANMIGPIAVNDFKSSEGYGGAVSGIAGGTTVQVQSSHDGVVWVNEGSVISADGAIAVTGKNLVSIRGDIAHVGTGTVKLTVAGRQ